ncbi:unnamed protein product [Acanthoscelides obtectus]|uniref:DDE-1 domain-containing protein n=1 Tax=Acanthoscelides obtectus TaxID=200917 RepID=A0A9P0LJ40_ACAOB|nr:unnamed protein product [Acanthoscelides obtectus]CAK1658572.1 hypothetical protein AOBTE_LOCUS20995 [Acanthoscelides obtectus]
MAFNLAQRMGIPDKFNQKEEINEIILFCLPAHTTHYLQPLDGAFFKTLKINFYAECRFMVQNNPNRVLNPLQFGKLLGRAWGN